MAKELQVCWNVSSCKYGLEGKEEHVGKGIKEGGGERGEGGKVIRKGGKKMSELICRCW